VFWQSDSSNYIYPQYWQGIVVMNVKSKPCQTLPFCELLCPALNLQNWIPQMLAIPFPNNALSGELALMFPILFGKFGMGCLSQIAVTCPPLYLNKT
jgi:hypothetical protein